MPDEPPQPTSVRLDPEVREFVQQVAAAERRSVNNTINVLLTEAMTARQAQKETDR